MNDGDMVLFHLSNLGFKRSSSKYHLNTKHLMSYYRSSLIGQVNLSDTRGQKDLPWPILSNGQSITIH